VQRRRADVKFRHELRLGKPAHPSATQIEGCASVAGNAMAGGSGRSMTRFELRRQVIYSLLDLLGRNGLTVRR
jgi:hypothetical protein